MMEKDLGKHIDIKETLAVLKFLQELNLKNIDFDEIRKKVSILHQCGFMTVTFPKGKVIYRGRPVEPDKLFTHVGEISYPPFASESVLRFNRATTNRYQIFYGAVPSVEMDAAQLIAMLEVGSIIDEDFDGKHELTAIGQWIVKEDFTIAVLGLHSEIAKANSQAQIMKESFASMNKQFNEKSEIIQKVAEFMSHEFEKDVLKDSPEHYAISAAYGDRLFDLTLPHGVGGILFPSKKSEGKGWNVAIHKDTVDKCLELRVAVVGRSTLVNKEIFVDWIKQSPTFTDGKFNWEDAPASAMIDKNQMIEILKNIEEHGGTFFNPKGIR